MNVFKFAQALVLTALVSASSAYATTPLSLNYTVTPDSGLYRYDFTLTLDNNDGSWLAGDAYAWLIFGDSQVVGGSPLSDFAMDSSQFPIGPWTYLQASIGGHNGPNLGYAGDYWTPASVGSFLTWSGVSANDVAQGSLLFSTLMMIKNGEEVTTDTVGKASFEVATRNAAGVPDGGATVAMIGAALAGFVLLRRRLRS